MKKIKLLTICLAISMMLPLAACGTVSTEVSNKAAVDVDIVLNDIATKNTPVYNALTDEDLEDQVAFYDSQYDDLRANWKQSGFQLSSQGIYYNAIKSAKTAEEEAGGTSSDCLGVNVKSNKNGYIASAELVYPTRNVILYITYNNDMVVTDISFTPVYSFGEVLKKASLNTLLGMGTVFIVLILIMFIIYLFGFIPKIEKKLADKKAKKAQTKTEPVDKTIAQIVEKEEVELADDYELVAVISAAIAAYEGNAGTDGFVVRSIKKSNSKKWQNAQY